jgi:uncharacterized protein
MKHWLALLGLILVFGCGEPRTNAATVTTTAKPPIPTEGTAVVTDHKPPQEQRERTRPENPRRIFQLDDLATTKIKIGKHELTVWIMDTMSKRQEGMMWLTEEEVKQDEGMLFVFPEAQPLSFWMQNTLIPLDIVFISDERRILNIGHGKPLDESGVPSEGDAKYVLEMKAGSMKRLEIKPGMSVEIPDNVRAKS